MPERNMCRNRSLDGPKGFQNPPGMVQNWSQVGPWIPFARSRAAPERPRGAKSGLRDPKILQEGRRASKRSPRGAREHSIRSPRPPEELPRAPKERPEFTMSWVRERRLARTPTNDRNMIGKLHPQRCKTVLPPTREHSFFLCGQQQ